MHILLIHQAFAALDEPGGTRHHELAIYLAESGHKVTIIASPLSYLTGDSGGRGMRWVEEQSGGEGITILRVYTYQALHRSFFHRVISFLSFMFSSFWIGLSVKNVDLVWGTSPPIFQGLTAWALARLKRARFLFEVRDLWPAFAVAVGVLTNPGLIRISEWLERFLYRRADQMMINSPGFRKHIESRGGKQIALIPNGADGAMFAPDSKGAQFRSAHGLEGKFVALYAGAHGMSNDLDVLLDAAKLLDDFPEVVIVLLGAGKEKARLQSRAEELGLTNLRFIPPVPKDEMNEGLAAADVCIAILKPIEMYKTVYPNKVFDYMAAGRPTLLAIDGVIREVVETARAGIFVPPGSPQALADGLRELAANPDQTFQMGANGREYLLEHFDRPKVAADLIELLENLDSQRF
ncbi:MAG: glycosyltransferase family 4 protein [Chloroflexota bacterium]